MEQTDMEHDRTQYDRRSYWETVTEIAWDAAAMSRSMAEEYIDQTVEDSHFIVYHAGKLAVLQHSERLEESFDLDHIAAICTFTERTPARARTDVWTLLAHIAFAAMREDVREKYEERITALTEARAEEAAR